MLSELGVDSRGHVPDRVLHARFVFRFSHPGGEHGCQVVAGELTVGIIEDDLALPGPSDDTGFQVVTNDPRDAATEVIEHRYMSVQPGGLCHIHAGFDKRIP